MKQSKYTRSTAQCKYADFKPAFIQKLNEYSERHKLENVEKEILHCFETTNIEKGFLGRTKTSYTEICITNRFLFWAVVTNKTETGIGAAQWSEISEIQDWETSEMGKIIADHGLELFGFIYQAAKRGRWFIGLGNDEPGNHCRKILKESVNKQ